MRVAGEILTALGSLPRQRAHRERPGDFPVPSQAVRRCSKQTSWSQALPPLPFQRVPVSRGKARLGRREAGSTGTFGGRDLLLRFTAGARQDAGEGRSIPRPHRPPDNEPPGAAEPGHRSQGCPLRRGCGSPRLGSASRSHRAQPSPARRSRTGPWHRAPAATGAPARSSPEAPGAAAGSAARRRGAPSSAAPVTESGAERRAPPLRPPRPRAAPAPAPHRPAPAAPRGPGRSRRSRRGVAGPPAAASPAPARCRGWSRSAAPSAPAPPPSPPAAAPRGGAVRGGTGRAPPPRAARRAGRCRCGVSFPQKTQHRPRKRVPVAGSPPGPGSPRGGAAAPGAVPRGGWRDPRLFPRPGEGQEASAPPAQQCGLSPRRLEKSHR